MSVSRCVRAGGAMAHLLLVVVLAFGVFVMHTVGHPDESSGAGMSVGAHASHGAAAGYEAGTAQHSSADEPASGPAMDMTSLCVAVLGVWALAALLYAAFTRRPGWLAELLARTVVALRPNAPPPRPDLTQLSVLRI
ncbi:DUF6153 family protein [Streptomyces sp. B-S-A8]|uniref:DUF6153 family protein n=1 Tax=Streptomyces solicavernae TaxID=3043614 RepID=A0ABT6RW22_9ACTN|nr:DUF6153 family protein [Streptomyces sp. B-S-A8]MDI3387953.1 DUF6153 family protein [Streptomyces sp. B-S-A8]